jgi:osmotically-inducible protein OsmY
MAERKGDRQTRDRIRRELERGGLTGLQVAVNAGRVTLSGVVDSYAKELAARDAVHRGAGVPEFEDNVHVRLPGTSPRSDSELAKAVARAFEFDQFVPDRKISLRISAGRVRLDGLVDFAREREDAVRVVRHVAGVTGIDNRIRVRRARDPHPGPPAAHPH